MGIIICGGTKAIMMDAKDHFNKIAVKYDFYKNKNSFYYENLKKLLGGLILRNKRVLEVGCGTGDLLGSLKPKKGYGQDISEEMIKIANNKYGANKNVEFSTSWPKKEFDYIFMSDVIEHLESPEEVFGRISRLMDENTVFINTMANPIWEPVLLIAEKLGLKMPEGKHKRIKYEDLRILIQESGLKIIKHDYKLLVPIYIPVVTKFVNIYLEECFKKFAFIEYLVAVRS